MKRLTDWFDRLNEGVQFILVLLAVILGTLTLVGVPTITTNWFQARAKARLAERLGYDVSTREFFWTGAKIRLEISMEVPHGE